MGERGKHLYVKNNNNNKTKSSIFMCPKFRIKTKTTKNTDIHFGQLEINFEKKYWIYLKKIVTYKPYLEVYTIELSFELLPIKNILKINVVPGSIYENIRCHFDADLLITRLKT